MTQNVGFVPQAQGTLMQAAPVQQPFNPVQFAQQQQQKPKGPNIWYRPVTQADYKKIAEMNTATVVIRILPGFNQSGVYEAVFEKNTANSKFPGTQRWVCPVMVLNDSLHPENNGFVGVMEVSKTLYNRIKNKNTPANYFDFNNGHNFHINVSLQQSKDGAQWFPNYNKSGFEAQPSPCQAQYAAQKMTEGKFADFATFMQRINTPKQHGPVAYNPMAPQAQQFTPVAQQPQMQQPVQFNPAAQTQFVPQATQFAPQQVVQQGPAGSESEFDEIFGQQ